MPLTQTLTGSLWRWLGGADGKSTRALHPWEQVREQMLQEKLKDPVKHEPTRQHVYPSCLFANPNAGDGTAHKHTDDCFKQLRPLNHSADSKLNTKPQLDIYNKFVSIASHSCFACHDVTEHPVMLDHCSLQAMRNPISSGTTTTSTSTAGEHQHHQYPVTSSGAHQLPANTLTTYKTTNCQANKNKQSIHPDRHKTEPLKPDKNSHLLPTSTSR